MQTELFDAGLSRTPVMGIFRGQGRERTLALCEAAWDFGVELVEVPVQGAEDLLTLRAAVEAGAGRGLAVGAGTILHPDQLDAVVDAGAAFTVSPGLDDDVVERAVRRGVPHLPGVATSTEVGRAVRAGCRWLKAFPAAELGSSWVAAQHGPFPEVRFVATGGIHAGNVGEFLDAGASAVAVGSAFATTDGIAALAAALSTREHQV